ncbi:MAG: hypothetical protein FJ146_06405 [Deltaproteobacteria bacterium]|nr:hypothetical protein [Deltaproteobacteria bacterium]
MRLSTVTAVFMLALTMVGCYSGDEAIVQGRGNLQQKGPTLGASGDAQLADAAKKVATATYFVEIETASGARPCEGTVTLDIMANFNIALPGSKVNCASLSIDLEKLLGAQLKGGASAIDLKSFQSDGLIFSASEILGAKFDPPRPMLVGPLIQDPSKFANLYRHVDSKVTVAKPESGPPLEATGSFDVKVIEVGGKYSNKFLKQPFDQVLHWTLDTSGFQGVPAKYGMLFKKAEWYWNVRPIMVPKIIITLEGISGMIESKAVDDLSDLVGELKVIVTVKDYDFSGG